MAPMVLSLRKKLIQIPIDLKINTMNSRKKLIIQIYIYIFSVGTTKTTSHIPGYNGFLPRTDLNEKALAQSLGLNTRETIIKQNIVENYNLKVPGYSGHKPMSALNDRGLLRP